MEGISIRLETPLHIATTIGDSIRTATRSAEVPLPEQFAVISPDIHINVYAARWLAWYDQNFFPMLFITPSTSNARDFPVFFHREEPDWNTNSDPPLQLDASFILSQFPDAISLGWLDGNWKGEARLDTQSMDSGEHIRLHNSQYPLGKREIDGEEFEHGLLFVSEEIEDLEYRALHVLSIALPVNWQDGFSQHRLLYQVPRQEIATQPSVLSGEEAQSFYQSVRGRIRQFPDEPLPSRGWRHPVRVSSMGTTGQIITYRNKKDINLELEGLDLSAFQTWCLSHDMHPQYMTEFLKQGGGGIFEISLQFVSEEIHISAKIWESRGPMRVLMQKINGLSMSHVLRFLHNPEAFQFFLSQLEGSPRPQFPPSQDQGIIYTHQSNIPKEPLANVRFDDLASLSHISEPQSKPYKPKSTRERKARKKQQKKIEKFLKRKGKKGKYTA